MDSYGEILRLCRLCLVKDQVSIPIFDDPGDLRQIFFKISSCLPVKISQEDRLPKKICDGCLNKLDIVYEFWNSTANAEKTLLSRLAALDEEKAEEPPVPKPIQETVVKEELELVEETKPDVALEESHHDETECPPSKRARTQINTELEEDDLDTAEVITKVEEEIDNEEVSFADMPSTSADDAQPGPSGLGKDGEEAPFEIISIKMEGWSEQPLRPKPYTCFVCMEKFSSTKDLTKHIKVHTEPPKISCDQCTKTFTNQESADVHTKVAHGSSVKCPECDAIFNHEEALDLHKKEAHLHEFNYYCITCKCGFVLFSDYKFHRETTHEPSKPCKECGVQFGSSRELKLHMVEHSKSKKRRDMKNCPICSESVGDLRRHYLHCHSDVKPFTCEICGKSFKQKSTLNLHIMVHKDIRPHMCEFCGNGFLTNNHLVTHRRTHTGEKPYECEVCDEKFGTRGTLVNHFRIHSGERPFICEHCGKTFARRKYLVSHYRHMHSDL